MFLRKRSDLTYLAAVFAITALASLTGCNSLGASGPKAHAIRQADAQNTQIKVVEANDTVVRSIIASHANYTFARIFGGAEEKHGLIGRGATLDISVWESPPAVLFPANAALLSPGAPAASTGTSFPGQVVNANGAINVPFAGSIQALGRTPDDVAAEIAARLERKAHDPQVSVRIADNQADGVIVAGDVFSSRRIPLTTKNERLLDALTDAGGVRQPVDKVLIQVTRGATVATRPLGAIIRDPGENIPLFNDDIVTALYQPFSFQAMGAVGANTEISFEGTGITLAQALARAGGLQDSRANVKGVFVFRFEDPLALPQDLRAGSIITSEGKIPVVYSIDMSNPATFFVMQKFPMHDKDILYASNAPLVDLQKFVGLVSQIAFSVAGIANTVP